MKKIKLWIIAGAAVLALALMLMFLLPGKGQQTPPDQPQPGTTQGAVIVTEPPVTDPMAQTQPRTEPETQPEATEATEETIPEETELIVEVTEPATTPPTSPPVTQPPVQYLSLPYQIPGSELVLSRYNAYTGPYLEDGSDRAVENMAALVIENRGSAPVEYAQITVTLENDETLEFVITALPAGASVVVQEAKAQTYTDGRLKNCVAHVAVLEEMPMCEDLVRIVEEENGVLSVTNVTGVEIPVVRIFYKFYLADVNGYVGGITYTLKLESLKPGETRSVAASHYMVGSSAVVMVRVYSFDE